MKLEDFDYHLPPELVAQYPARRREDARMLVVRRASGDGPPGPSGNARIFDAQFRQLPEFLEPSDVLVVNNSRVLPARLLGRRLGVRAQRIGKRNPAHREYLTSPIEVLLVRRLDESDWEALVHPGRKVRPGEKLIFEAGQLTEGGSGKESLTLEAEVVGHGEYGLRTLRFAGDGSLEKKLQRIGHVPLPPYIHRPDEKLDRLRYQTVYARRPGSVAAPTAGLHVTRRMLGELEKRGIEVIKVTLHVGLGTFQPVHESQIEQHTLHPEQFEVSPEAAARLNHALEEKRRVVAVGTTSVRTLEHVAAAHRGRIAPENGETQLFILPGFRFRVVGGLLTNFHLPRTTLLMLVSAFAGRELILAAYEHAVRERYRFYSYGDCMLIL
ncbi:MAG: tRNA preQ1(34) S-adenosylmethionine ribosyltransferase-isomerase QueA [Acidobacteria bacterium RIFCSPLOWO2_02_FULL_61_28]|nr:MAG: tRNA preQ1(34) S-adenosylmethionine ribosyltransferase-isomerase QueA [Acidobacteria bacterium RIFCSPLOWO2_02_FULL_61_28]